MAKFNVPLFWHMSFWKKLLNWYFNKKSLPYWCIFLRERGDGYLFHE